MSNEAAGSLQVYFRGSSTGVQLYYNALLKV